MVEIDRDYELNRDAGRLPRKIGKVFSTTSGLSPDQVAAEAMRHIDRHKAAVGGSSGLPPEADDAWDEPLSDGRHRWELGG